MNYIDVFNGDADGICALIQLRRSQPQNSDLITGVKREINLLKYIESGKNADITVLDISLEKNLKDAVRLLEDGAHISYYDHHQIGEGIKHKNLMLDIDLSADVCTSLIVDKKLGGQFKAWAITAAFGDNLNAKATEIAKQANFSDIEIAQLQELGIYINYNGYGASIDDLFFNPEELYRKLVQFDTPFEFIENDQVTFNTLKNGYSDDILHAEKGEVVYESKDIKVILLPNEKWARRVSGVFGNELANAYPDRAHAIVTDKGDDTYLVSVRAPLHRKSGADEVVSQFPTGGGRKAAAGINALPKTMLTDFIHVFEQQYLS